jgi:Rrf2 family nitric oxide-sensitive transcriptional repressor
MSHEDEPIAEGRVPKLQVQKPRRAGCLTTLTKFRISDAEFNTVIDMQLTRFTDLGLRAVMLLATGDVADRRVTTRSIAASSNASDNHVAKAVSRLVELGLVEARRGRSGGLSITDAGRRASIGWLVRELEGDHDVIDCRGENPCPLIAGCRLRWALSDAKDAFYRTLDELTVDDLVNGRTLQITARP